MSLMSSEAAELTYLCLVLEGFYYGFHGSTYKAAPVGTNMEDEHNVHGRRRK